MKETKIKILAISGSLRSNSSNHKIINTIATMMPGNIDFTIYQELGNLPHFNDEDSYEIVHEWRRLIKDADGVLICTPEYAFGVPGSLKNALDWTVSSGDFYNKPVALITASTGGDKAHASLLQTLTALTAKMTEGTTLLIPFIRSKFNERGEVTDLSMLNEIKKLIDNLIQLIGSSVENSSGQ
jgi:NAD(P)H-dependent FMN reductase